MTIIIIHLGNLYDYYLYRNVNICFPAVSKFYGENNMMKKLLTRLTGLDKFLIVNKNQASLYNIVKFIKTSKFLLDIY